MLDLDPSEIEITTMSAFDIAIYERLLAADDAAFDADAPAYVITDLETGAQNRVQAYVIAFGARAFTVEGGARNLSASAEEIDFGSRAGKSLVALATTPCWPAGRGDRDR